MRIATIFLLAMALAGCSSTSLPPTPATPTKVLPDVAQCQSQGGEIRPVCRRGTPTCVIAYPDAGHACSDGSQCKGRCVVNPQDDMTTPTNGKAVGVCEADSDRCGCSAEIIAGVAQAKRCVD